MICCGVGMGAVAGTRGGPLPWVGGPPRERASRSLRALRETGYRTIVLDRLVEHACRLLDVEQACVYVQDDADISAMIVAAATGTDEDLVARRVRDDDVVDLVMTLEELVVVTRGEDGVASGGETNGRATDARAVAPIDCGGAVRGALSVSTSQPGRMFDRRDLMMLGELADLAAAALDHARLPEGLERLAHAHVESLASSIAVGERYPPQQPELVAELAVRIGERLGLDHPSLLELEFAARLRDIGKIGVPDEILLKPGPLDPEEWKVVRSHPIWSAETLAHTPGLQVVASLVQFHHERWDGGGYPDGLEGERIPLPSRIVLACEALVSMASPRPYRRRLDRDEALDELRAGAGSQFDPVVVESLIEVVEDAAWLAGRY
jgi:hypothetical protein